MNWAALWALLQQFLPPERWCAKGGGRQLQVNAETCPTVHSTLLQRRQFLRRRRKQIQGVQKVTKPVEKCNINFIFIIMPISYNKCWKCQLLRSSQRCTRRIMLANTCCNVPVDILSTARWMLAWSSCSVCGWFEYTVSLRCPHKKTSEGLKSGDRGGRNLFEMRRPGNTDSE
jgi:hypothetical protein